MKADLEAGMAEAVAGSDDGSARTVNVSIDEQAPSADTGSRMRTRVRGRRRLQDVSLTLVGLCFFLSLGFFFL